MPGKPSSSYQDIYAVVSRIPRGRVATYGQVAGLAGRPRQARLVGYALHALPPGTRVPWHRVVNARGQVSLRGDGSGFEDVQVELLTKEGVRFVGGAIALERCRWEPGASGLGLSPRPRRAIKRR
jgi:methylated-DNA-protein-cysteine methyltransferase-like protein